MGFETQDYAAAKAVTHPRMAHLGQLLTIDRAEAESEQALGKLMGALDL
ncbi:MAG: hypothetical protein QHC67_14730 [Sphingobium sp.]|nr:hypothetical protein [Sphingobium sp.]MDX3911057.1 hypothetical protein [Sphingobium sp.]